MPELPEVETIASFIRSSPLIRQRVTNTCVYWKKSLAIPDSPEQFDVSLTGQTLIGVDRRGKYLLLNFGVDVLMVHLRMSGDIRIEASSLPTQFHDRIEIIFANNYRLSFNDPRKFGRMWLVKDPFKVLSKLGLEPLDPTVTPQQFYVILQRTRRCIKPLLLDQSIIAGMGNIYTDEALHLARLHPKRPANQLSLAQTEQLLDAIRHVLREGITHHGASIDWVYRGGDFQNHFRVYQRTGQPCPACGSAVERMVVGQRGTHFCPKCQALSGDINGEKHP